MKNVKIIKGAAICLVLVLMLSVGSMSAFAASQSGASLGHTNDEWEYGPTNSLWPWNWDKCGQYSEFYCDQVYHTATARVRTSDQVLHEDKEGKSADKWAKADTGLYSDVTEWKSYYNHP